MMGTIVEVEGDYFLQTPGVRTARKKEMVKIGSMAEKEKYSKLVGQRAEVILSEPVRSVIAIAVKPDEAVEFKCYLILCYIPNPLWIFPLMNRELIKPLAEQFLKEGILSQENFDRVMDAASF